MKLEIDGKSVKECLYPVTLTCTHAHMHRQTTQEHNVSGPICRMGEDIKIYDNDRILKTVR